MPPAESRKADDDRSPARHGDEIGTAVLRGAVGTLPERLAAAHDARDVEGVFEVVVDDLTLHPPVALRRTDDEIRASVTGVVGVTNRIEIR